MTRVLYVRHGESTSTVQRTIGGHRTCGGLSELGHRQAAALRDRWAGSGEVTPNVLISSHYRRARETAAYISEAFAAMPVEIDEGFGEHDPGEACDGMGMQQFVERYGTEGWSEDPFGVTFPGGETLAAFQFGVGLAVRRLVDHHPDSTIVVVCHGGVVDTVLRQAMKAAPTGGFQIHTLNTSITEISLTAPNLWVLHRFGDTAHLAGLPASTARIASTASTATTATTATT